METLTSNFHLRYSPVATIILDRNLKVIKYSDILKRNFPLKVNEIIEKKISEVLEDIPLKLLEDLQRGLQGETIENKGHKYLQQTKRPKWLKWIINPWKFETNIIGGIVLVLEDVSNFKKEQELILKAERVSKTGSWELDLTTNEIYWSPMTKIMHEVPLDFAPVLEEGLEFYKEGASRERIALAVSNAISEGIAYDEELILITAKGNERWVRAKGEPEMVDGKCVRLFGTIQDIDKKKKAELKYFETSERLKIATKTANIGVFQFELTENKILWDDNMYELHGVSKNISPITYEIWASTVHPEDLDRVTHEFELALKGEKDFNQDFRIICQDNIVKHVKGLLAVTKRDENDNPLQVIGANWDISELKNTKLQLERSKASFSETFQNSAAGMALVDIEGRWLQVNNEICRSLGYSEDELLKLTFQDITHPDDLNKDLNHLNEIVEGKRDSYQIEKRYFHKNGTIIYAILTVTVVRKINGDISHFISQVLDITSRVESEKRLNSLVDVTKEQNESLTNYAHIVSHNLRSHSINMNMLTKFLKEETNEAERKNLINMLSNASNSLAETIHHLNEVVQVKTGTLEKMQSVSLLAILKKIERSLKALLRDKNAHTNLEVSKSHFIMGVPAYIESIFFNLYTNSLKYSAKERNPVINITSKVKKGNTEITFSDNGLGIDLERHGEKIFGMFKTFHNNKDAKGIGLFITKNQIESMGGTIKVKSEINKGTTFIVTLQNA